MMDDPKKTSRTFFQDADQSILPSLVHAKGAGAYGVLEVTHDISDLTMADFLKQVGKKTRLFARFSTVVGERGSADSVRDSRGFAFKLYTEQGNLDWLFFSTVCLFIFFLSLKYPPLTI